MGLWDFFRSTPCPVEGKPEDRKPPEMMGSLPRSPQWPRVRADHLAAHPRCEGCGSERDLNAHHRMPYHKFPHKELDPENLITLCEGPSNCHYMLGHGGVSWSAYNPGVWEAAGRFRQLLEWVKSSTVRG